MIEYAPEPKMLNSFLPAEILTGISDKFLVSDIHTDSRLITPGALFIASQGLNANGVAFISDAVEKGAVAVLVDEKDKSQVPQIEVPVLSIENLKAEIPVIVSRFFDFASGKTKIFGVTGTNGKSTIVSLVAQLFTLSGMKSASIGTVGYGFPGEYLTSTEMTTPDLVSTHRIIAELVEKKAQVIAMEISSHGIHQKRIESLQFSACVLSNISRDHLDYHGSFENYKNTKASLFEDYKCDIAILNSDDEHCREITEKLVKSKQHVLTYGIESVEADVKATNVIYSRTGLVADISSPWGDGVLATPLLGRFNLSNILAAITLLCTNGLPINDVLKNAKRIKPVPGRMQLVSLSSSKSKLPAVYVDYAHTPDALEKVLEAIEQHSPGKTWVVFGCGGDRDSGKRALMGAVVSKRAARIIVTSDNPRTEQPEKIIEQIMVGIKTNNCETIPDRESAISFAISRCHSDDVVLIAGKGHENYQIIGEKRKPFSDYLVAKKALIKREMGLGSRGRQDAVI